MVRHLQTHPFLMRGGASCQAPPGKWGSWGLVVGGGSPPRFLFTPQGQPQPLTTEGEGAPGRAVCPQDRERQGQDKPQARGPLAGVDGRL